MKRLLCLLAAAAPLLAQQWPLSDPHLGPAPGGRQRPRVAAGANGFLAAWSDFRLSHDVWGTRFDNDGRALGSVHVAENADLLALASDGDGYLAVVAPVDCSGIDAIPIAADGTAGAPAHVADVLYCPLEASAASNGSTVLVVYSGHADERMRIVMFGRGGKRLRGPLPLDARHLGSFAAGSNGRDYLVLIGGTAVPIDANGNAAAPRKTGANDFAAVALAPHGDGYLLLDGTLRTQVLAADGTPAGPPHQLQMLPAFTAHLTWTGSEYVAAWTTFSPPFTNRMTIARIAADGTFLSSRAEGDSPPSGFDPIDVASARGVTLAVRETIDQQMHAATIAPADVDAGVIPAGEVISLSAAPQLRPRMAAVPGGAAMAWIENGRVNLRLLDADGHPSGDVVTAALGGAAAHQIAFDGTNLVVAALYQRGITAQRFTTSLQPVDAQPLPIALPTSASDFALAAADDGVSLLAWNDGEIEVVELRDGGPSPRHSIAFDNDDNPPSAAWDGHTFVVAYSRRPPAALAAVRVDPKGAPFVPLVIADIASPAVRSAVAPAPGGVFGAWSNFGIAARIFGTRSDLAGAAAPRLLSPAGVVEGPFLVDGSFAAWTLATGDGLQLQWRALNGEAIASLPPQPRLGALEPSLVSIGSNVFAAYEHYDEADGGVPRIFIHVLPPPRHRIAGR
jgi:hypothetical protein